MNIVITIIVIIIIIIIIVIILIILIIRLPDGVATNRGFHRRGTNPLHLVMFCFNCAHVATFCATIFFFFLCWILLDTFGMAAAAIATPI